MLFRNGAKSQITSKPPTRKENFLTLNCKMSFSPDVRHTDLELRDGNDTLGRLASVCALSQRQVSSRVRTTSTSHTIGSAYDGGPARQGLTLGTTKYRVDAIKKDLGNDQAWSVIDGLVPHRFDRKGLIS
ncbi:hypothetical protein M0657_002041 [Pyricularia oryzae]|nr:hypothetical protein M9X92_001516 [Pyricularia oryzae]KAI7929564.1 hypothetical protein M0657_002041 [Pyricularia oryzae]